MPSRRSRGRGAGVGRAQLSAFLDDAPPLLEAMPDEVLLETLADEGVPRERVRHGAVRTLAGGHRKSPLPSFGGILRGIGVDFERDLVGHDFSRLRLRDENFAGADLSRVVFDGADLSGANLEGARLVEARLRDVTLTRAILRNAALDGADVTGADLTDADMAGATFSGVDLGSAAATPLGPLDAGGMLIEPGPRRHGDRGATRRVEDLAFRLAAFHHDVDGMREDPDCMSETVRRRAAARRDGDWAVYCEASLDLALLCWAEGSLRDSHGILDEALRLSVAGRRAIPFGLAACAAALDVVHPGTLLGPLRRVGSPAPATLEDVGRQLLLRATRLFVSGDARTVRALLDRHGGALAGTSAGLAAAAAELRGLLPQ